RIEWTPTMAEKNGHKHFMHKEIHEQARALTDTIRGRASVEEGDVYLDGCRLDGKLVQRLTKVQIVACGTSWHASITGKLMIETLARIPVEVDLASEFRYRDPLIDSRTLCIAVSQSGETADTLGSFREAKTRGARGLAVCNVVGSAIARESDDVLYTHAGPVLGGAGSALPRAGTAVSRRARGRPQAEGNLVHPCGGICRGGDEARPHRAHRREHAGDGARAARLRRTRRSELREDPRQHPGSEGPRRPRHRHLQRGRQGGAHARGVRHPGPADERTPLANPLGHPDPARR